MEITLTIKQEEQLLYLAGLEGKGADELAREVLLRGLKVEEATLIASRPHSSEGNEAVARMLELRRETCFPKV